MRHLQLMVAAGKGAIFNADASEQCMNAGPHSKTDTLYKVKVRL